MAAARQEQSRGGRSSTLMADECTAAGPPEAVRRRPETEGGRGQSLIKLGPFLPVWLAPKAALRGRRFSAGIANEPAKPIEFRSGAAAHLAQLSSAPKTSPSVASPLQLGRRRRKAAGARRKWTPIWRPVFCIQARSCAGPQFEPGGIFAKLQLLRTQRTAVPRWRASLRSTFPRTLRKFAKSGFQNPDFRGQKVANCLAVSSAVPLAPASL